MWILDLRKVLVYIQFSPLQQQRPRWSARHKIGFRTTAKTMPRLPHPPKKKTKATCSQQLPDVSYHCRLWRALETGGKRLPGRKRSKYVGPHVYQLIWPWVITGGETRENLPRKYMKANPKPEVRSIAHRWCAAGGIKMQRVGSRLSGCLLGRRLLSSTNTSWTCVSVFALVSTNIAPISSAYARATQDSTSWCTKDKTNQHLGLGYWTWPAKRWLHGLRSGTLYLLKFRASQNTVWSGDDRLQVVLALTLSQARGAFRSKI